MKHAAIRFVFVLAPTAVFTLLTYWLHGRPPIGIDDANIFFVYASNLASGHGFVYNLTDGPVEGFTSMLWLLVCALFLYLSHRPELHLLIVCVVMVAVTLSMVTSYIDKMFARRPAGLPVLSWVSIAFLATVFAYPPYVTWMTITLMDTCLWGLLLTSVVLFLLTDRDRPARWSSPLFALLMLALMLARPESIVLCPVFVAIHWAQRSLLCRSAKEAARAGSMPLLTYLVSAAGLTCFRVWYFGFPLPNTYYAKVSRNLAYNLSAGDGYVESFAMSHLFVGPAILMILTVAAIRLAGVVGAALRMRAVRQRLLKLLEPGAVVSILCVVLLLIPVLTGGDHFRWWRLYQPVYPLILLSVLCATHDMLAGGMQRRWIEMKPGLKRAIVFAAVALISLSACLPTDASWLGLRQRQPIGHEFTIATDGQTIGRQFALEFAGLPQLPSLGVVVAGGIKRTYPGRVIDLMGLNNLEMGHSPGERIGIKNHAAFNRDVFFRQVPNVVLPVIKTLPSDSTDAVPSFQGGDVLSATLRRLDKDAEFLDLYNYAAVRRKGSTGDQWPAGFFHRDMLAELLATDMFETRVARNTPAALSLEVRQPTSQRP